VSYPVTFTRAVSEVLAAEGGYVNDPRDPGGETLYGISKRAYPHLDIAALTQDDAIAIYYSDYWLKAGCDKFPASVAGVLFDAAVNQGVGRAVQMLQASVGATVDGAVGPDTIRRASTNPLAVIADFTTQRVLHYAALPAFKTYGKGWTLRAVKSAMRATL
jgi:lysozyme family protein